LKTAIFRVAERVKQGGHDIPESVIRRRFYAGMANFELKYKSLVDVWLHFNNSGEMPALIDWSEQ
jgi:predicted ABC-type ATPase